MLSWKKCVLMQRGMFSHFFYINGSNRGFWNCLTHVNLPCVYLMGSFVRDVIQIAHLSINRVSFTLHPKLSENKSLWYTWKYGYEGTWLIVHYKVIQWLRKYYSNKSYILCIVQLFNCKWLCVVFHMAMKSQVHHLLLHVIVPFL